MCVFWFVFVLQLCLKEYRHDQILYSLIPLILFVISIPFWAGGIAMYASYVTNWLVSNTTYTCIVKHQECLCTCTLHVCPTEHVVLLYHYMMCFCFPQLGISCHISQQQCWLYSVWVLRYTRSLALLDGVCNVLLFLGELLVIIYLFDTRVILKYLSTDVDDIGWWSGIYRTQEASPVLTY